MSKRKEQIRAKFRTDTFKRDGYKCAVCKVPGRDPHDGNEAPINRVPLDAHHIWPREDMPNGGYVKENGISLCPPCHIKAEDYLQRRELHDDYAPEDLYRLINSSYELAHRCATRLKDT